MRHRANVGDTVVFEAKVVEADDELITVQIDGNTVCFSRNHPSIVTVWSEESKSEVKVEEGP